MYNQEHSQNSLNSPSIKYNCYNCKYLDLSPALVALTRLDNKARVDMTCKKRLNNSEEQADYYYLMAECSVHHNFHEEEKEPNTESL